MQTSPTDELGSRLAICQARLNHQLPLVDYLLKPVQRLLKYPLLLSEQIKGSTPADEG